MTNEEICDFCIKFLPAFSSALWSFSEESNLPLYEAAPLVLGMVLGSPGKAIAP